MIEDWLKVRGDLPGALICPVNKGGKVFLRHFARDGDGIYKLVKARAKYLGKINCIFFSKISKDIFYSAN
jgi:integrase/recombinase XerD